MLQLPMPSDLRAYFESRAHELSTVADLDVSPLAEFGEVLTLTPRNRGAIGVYLVDFATGTYQVAFDHGYSVPDEDAQDVDEIDYFINLALSGGLRLLVHRQRAEWRVRGEQGWEVVGTYYGGLRSLISLPGWRRRAELIEFRAWEIQT